MSRYTPGELAPSINQTPRPTKKYGRAALAGLLGVTLALAACSDGEPRVTEASVDCTVEPKGNAALSVDTLASKTYY